MTLRRGGLGYGTYVYHPAGHMSTRLLKHSFSMQGLLKGFPCNNKLGRASQDMTETLSEPRKELKLSTAY